MADSSTRPIPAGPSSSGLSLLVNALLAESWTVRWSQDRASGAA